MRSFKGNYCFSVTNPFSGFRAGKGRDSGGGRGAAAGDRAGDQKQVLEMALLLDGPPEGRSGPGLQDWTVPLEGTSTWSSEQGLTRSSREDPAVRLLSMRVVPRPHRRSPMRGRGGHSRGERRVDRPAAEAWPQATGCSCPQKLQRPEGPSPRASGGCGPVPALTSEDLPGAGREGFPLL